MKLTNLSKGGGYYFPPCHMLELCGFRLLLECPLDLSALTVFSPIPANPSAALEASPLIGAEPWYKTVKNLHLWDPSLIDAVLVSSPTGMLGLPFLTRNPRFSAKIYATEVAARIGQLMMEELVSMHSEFVRFYGPDERSGFPEWMKWGELERLPLALREVVVGEAGVELGSWMALYSAEDVKECMLKIQSLKYAEEACYNGTLLLKAFSSGLEIGSCNWTINGPRRNVTYLSSSIFDPACAMGFDYHSLQGNDLILFSDFSSLYSMADNGTNTNKNGNDDGSEDKDPLPCNISAFSEDEVINCLLGNDESSAEIDKLNFICSCVMDSLKGGGSVLIPIGRLGIILLLLEQISQLLESSNMKVPMFMISSAAEETLTFTNAVPEWLSKQRQEKLFSGEALFGHVKLMKEKKLHLSPQLYSPNLLMTWQEPCVVFSAHCSLRLGPIVHLLHRWHSDNRCLLILEQGLDAEVALLPFKTLAIRVLQCSFLSGIKLQKVPPLLKLLQPKLVLFPEELRWHYPFTDDNPASILYYSESATLRVPSLRENFEACLARDLAVQLKPTRLAQENSAIARLKCRLLLRNGIYHLVPAMKSAAGCSNQELLHWGSVDPARLLLALRERGIDGSIVRDEDGKDGDVYTIKVEVPEGAVIETSATKTVICAADETMAALIYEVLSTVCK